MWLLHALFELRDLLRLVRNNFGILLGLRSPRTQRIVVLPDSGHIDGWALGLGN